MSTIAAELQELQAYEVYEPIVRHLGIAALALYVWDFVLTFHHEVAILWVGVMLYILSDRNRHFTLGDEMVDLKVFILLQSIFFTWCNHILYVYGFSNEPKSVHMYLFSFPVYLFIDNSFLGHGLTSLPIIAIVLVLNIEIILLRRLFILYEYNKVVVIPMVALYIAVFGYMIGIAIAFSVYSQANEYVMIGICMEQTPSWFLPFWIPLMAFDFVIVILAGFKSVQRYRHIPDKSWFSARFMKVLARDSFIYFSLNSLNFLLITLILQVAPPEFYALGESWTAVIPPITANRLLINMEYSQIANTTTTSSSVTVNANTIFSSVEFAGEVEATTSLV